MREHKTEEKKIIKGFYFNFQCLARIILQYSRGGVCVNFSSVQGTICYRTTRPLFTQLKY